MTAFGFDSGDRLERALAMFLAAAPTTSADADRLLAANPELADLLAPMLGRESPHAPGATTARGLSSRETRAIARGFLADPYMVQREANERGVASHLWPPQYLAAKS
jgi:hypothetical protein